MVINKTNSIFDKIKDISYRTNFIAYKNNRISDENILRFTKDYIMSDKCVTDIERLQSGDYYFSIPKIRLIPKNNSNRKRIIYRFNDDETALMRLIAYSLQDMDYLFCDGLYSFRRGKSPKDYFIWRKNNFFSKGCYVIKADIKSYGHSLNVEILIDKIKKIFIKDYQFCEFLVWLLSRKTYIDHGKIIQGNTSGLPGCPIHSFLTNIYLSEVDDYFYNKCISYARYSDDILMYVKSEKDVKDYFKILLKMVNELKLEFNNDKTKVCKSFNSIDFLGMEISDSDIDISPISIKKIKRRMRIRAKKIVKEKHLTGMSMYDAGRLLISLNANTFFGIESESRMSWARWAFPIITKIDRLIELDLYNQYCIRYVMTEKWTKSQYRITYQELKNIGYKSLVRLYYSHKEA